MEKITKDDPAAQSADIVGENIQRLKELFPEAVTEGRIDFEVLRQLLGDEVDDRDEKYGLNWNGKRKARQLALTPSLGTLRPCPEESVDWDTTKNIFIEGDNLEVLKLLQKSYAGKVKLIYIDPPYNTGNDFVYKDDFQDNIKNYQMLIGARDSDGRAIEANPESSGRFHTEWLNMMYPRLRIARSLLKENGFLAVSISDVELHNLRAVLDELFGESSLVECFVWESIFRPSNMSRRTRKNAEYILLYIKDADIDFEMIERFQDPQGDASLTQNNNSPRTLLFPKQAVVIGLPDGEYKPGVFGEVELVDPLIVQGGKNAADFRITGRFKWSQEYLDSEISYGVTLTVKSESMIPYYRKTYKQTALRPTKIVPNDLVKDVLAANAELASLFDQVPFQYPKPTSLIRFLATITGVGADEVIMDFFAGSGTSGHAAMARSLTDAQSVRYLLVQIPQLLSDNEKGQEPGIELCRKLSLPMNLAELTKERLRRAGAKLREENPMFSGDLGFRVFKLDSSNIRAWNGEDDDVEGQLDLHINHLVDGRTEQDVLYELLLKLGLDLCVPIETKAITTEKPEKTEGKARAKSSVPSVASVVPTFEVHSVGGGVLMVCLATSIPTAQVEALGLGIVAWHKEQAPEGETQVVFRDSAFEDDVAKTNMTAILEQNGIKTVRSL